ncbi:MAG: shikimate kinase [bacterium]
MMSSFANRRKCVFLIGFSGSGKSTLGPLLARRLKLSFHDTDALIEHRSGKNVDRIFTEDREVVFRRLEEEVISNLLTSGQSRMVIALGGGAFACERNRRRIQENGVVVYLGCSTRELYRRLAGQGERPLLRVQPRKGETLRQARLRRIKRLRQQRRAVYAMADIKVSTTDRTVSQTVQLLDKRIRTWYDHH